MKPIPDEVGWGYDAQLVVNALLELNDNSEICGEHGELLPCWKCQEPDGAAGWWEMEQPIHRLGRREEQP
jgi:hypothetical protein